MHRIVWRYFLTNFFRRRPSNAWVRTVLRCEQFINAFILSHPRAGRQWTLSLLCTYFNQLYHLGLDNDVYDTFRLIMPGSIKNITEYPRSTRFEQIPFIIPTHRPYDIYSKRLFDGKDLIVLLRSIEDMALSYYFKKAEFAKTYKSDLSSFLRDESLGIPNVCKYYNDLAEHISAQHFLVIRYEDLNHDIKKHIIEILKFLKVPIDMAAIDYTIAHNNFSEMQNRYLETKVKVSAKGQIKRPNSWLVRRGCIGESKECMASEDLIYIDNMLRQELSPKAKNFLNKHLRDRDYLKQHSV